MKRIIEIQTPRSLDSDGFAEGLANLAEFDSVILEECGGVDAGVLGSSLSRESDKEIFLKLSCRDRNRIALHSQLLTAASAGLLNVVLVDGMYPSRTPFPAAKPVYEMDALSLTQMIRGTSNPFSEHVASPLPSVDWTIAVCIGGSTAADLARAKKLLAAGADILLIPAAKDVFPLREMTDKPIVLSIAAEDITDPSQPAEVAEAAGADGFNLIVGDPNRLFDGTITAR